MRGLLPVLVIALASVGCAPLRPIGPAHVMVNREGHPVRVALHPSDGGFPEIILEMVDRHADDPAQAPEIDRHRDRDEQEDFTAYCPCCTRYNPCALRDEAACAIRPNCLLEEAELRLPPPDVAAEMGR